MSRVVVAHEESEIREPAVKVARELGLEVVGVADGNSAMTLLRWAAPDVLLTDVGLPEKLGFELVEEIERLALPTRVILIASVYSKTAYKRRPSTLYGAFDYIEQHHISDDLAGKLWRALEGAGDATRDAGENTLARERDQIEDAGTRRLRFDAAAVPPVENAQRLARLLVADVLLYSGQEAASWIDKGAHGSDLPRQLALDLREARRLFNAEVPEPIRARRDFISEALELAVQKN